MAFDVSYIFTAKNKYTPTAKKIIAVNEKVKVGNKQVARSFLKQNSALRKVKASLLIARRRLRDYRKESRLAAKGQGALIGKFKQFAVVALAGLGIAKIIQEGAAFEDSMADLSAITGAAGEDLDFLKSKVRSLAEASKVMPTDVALAFKSVASAKPELLENTKLLSLVTEKVLLLKNAAGIEMVAAVDTVTRGLNIFGAEADQAGKFVDILAAGAKFGSSEIANTGQAMLIAGGAAVDAGLSFTELNSAIQVVAKGGFLAEQAGTGLQSIFLRLTKAGFDFKNLGVDGVMSQVAIMLDKTEGSAAKAQLKSKLFGEEHQKIAGALLRNIPLITELNQKLNTSGIAAEQARIRMATFNSSIKGMKVNLALLASKVFDVARPAFAALSGTVANFIASMDPADIEAFGLLMSGVGRAAQGAAVVIGGAFRIIMTVLKPVLAILKGIGEAIGQTIAAIATLDFSGFDLSKSFDIGGKFLGLFGGETPEVSPAVAAVAAAPPAAIAAAVPAVLAAAPTALPTPAEAAVTASPAAAVTASPAVATANARATVNGNITVSATEGSRIDSIESEQAFNGAQGNIGLGAAA